MSRDIYANYLNKSMSSNKQDIIQKPKNHSLNAPIKGKGNEINYGEDTVKILREISSKLDKVNVERENYKSDESIELTQQSESYVDLCIINGKVVLPDNGIFKTDVYINNGKVHSLGKNDSLKARKTIDATNKYVIPGVIDPHVHLGLFAPLETELVTETKAALMGGITTMGCFFGSENSHFDTLPSILDNINEKSNVDIVPHLVISSQVQRKEILDYINHLGVTSFKVYMNGIPNLIPDVDDGFILDVFEEIKKSSKECIVCSHSENRHLVRRAYNKVKENKGDTANASDWAETHPDIVEEEAVMRLAFLAEKMDVDVYFVHISSGAAINRLRKLKPFNKHINIETTSPYLSITKNSVKDNSIIMEPPFREIEDVEQLWRAVDDEIVDTIGTDNVTMTKSEKNMDKSVWDTLPGYAVLETHLPNLLYEGVVKRGISLERIVSKITKKPAEIFNIYPQKGTLLPGSDGDAVIVDLDLTKKVITSNLSTRSDFSIYDNKTIQGWPITTIKSGEVVVQDGQYLDKSSKGKYISR